MTRGMSHQLCIDIDQVQGEYHEGSWSDRLGIRGDQTPHHYRPPCCAVGQEVCCLAVLSSQQITTQAHPSSDELCFLNFSWWCGYNDFIRTGLVRLVELFDGEKVECTWLQPGNHRRRHRHRDLRLIRSAGTCFLSWLLSIINIVTE